VCVSSSASVVCVRPIVLGASRLVPCGQCIECRLRRSRDWAVRCMHEASLHEENSYITLTYADEYLPKGGTLDRRAFPLFMKRLRKEVGAVRYFHAGEYGEENGRPHYHALLFGLRFGDERACGVSKSGFAQFASDTLSDVWSFGFHTIGAVSFESAQYVARYCVKKVTGAGAAAHYERVDAQGVIHQLEPEYATMSRRPGIGAKWIEKYRGDVYRDDGVMARGHLVVPPRYYDKVEGQVDVRRLVEVKGRRALELKESVDLRELRAREALAVARVNLHGGAYANAACVAR